MSPFGENGIVWADARPVPWKEEDKRHRLTRL